MQLTLVVYAIYTTLAKLNESLSWLIAFQLKVSNDSVVSLFLVIYGRFLTG